MKGRPRTTAHDQSSMSSQAPAMSYVPQQPYGRPTTTMGRIDKSSIIWRDFLNGVRRRKRLINHIRKVALDENDLSITLKRLLLEMRQITLKIIEDALEMEYRSQIGDTHSKTPLPARAVLQLPPITTFRGLGERDDILMLSDMISDMDDLYSMPNIQAFLPLNFPFSRNPFLLGKTVDGLANLEAPRPEQGNIDMELKALEFLRYKRAAKCLLRAEAQVTNKMPLQLEDVECLWKRIPNDSHVSLLIRVIVTLMHPDNIKMSSMGPELRYLMDDALYMEPDEFLRQLNVYQQPEKYALELTAAIMHVLKSCSTKSFSDVASAYLMEWLKAVLGDHIFEHDQPREFPPMVDYDTADNDASDSSSRSRNHRNKQSNSKSKSSAGNNVSFVDHSNDFDDEDNKSNGSDSLDNSMEMKSPTSHNSPTAARISGLTPKMKRSSSKQAKSPMVSKTVGFEDTTSQDDSSRQSKQSKQNKGKKMNAVEPPPLKPKRRLVLPKGSDFKFDATEVTAEGLNSLKYEIIKMQQELLRRKILDPNTFGNQMGKRTASGRPMSSKGDKDKKKEKAPLGPPITDMTDVETGDEAAHLRVMYGVEQDEMSALVIVQEQVELSFCRVGFVEILMNESKSSIYVQYKGYPDAAGEEPKDGSEFFVKDTQAIQEHEIAGEPNRVVVFNTLNNQLFDRLNGGLQIETVGSGPVETRRGHLTHFIGLIKKHLEQKMDRVKKSQRIDFDVNLCLVEDVLISGNISVDVSIERADNCTGILVKAVPRLGALLTKESMDTSPITIFMHDKELKVLLINQRGLYELALKKWSCMEMIAKWLLGRMTINRIPLPLYDQNKRNTTDVVTHFDNTGKPVKDVDPTSKQARTYFEVIVNRSIELNKEVLKQWRARNVPNLVDVRIEHEVSARQDLDMLYFHVILKLSFVPPHVIAFRKKEKAEAKEIANKLLQFKSKFDDDYINYSRPRQIADIPFDEDPEVIHTVIDFDFGLTGNELLTFGTGESIDHTSKRNDSNYESTLFMKNVLNRLHISFKGSKNDPHKTDKPCVDQDMWEAKYNRKLLRDVRTVTGGVMVVVASAVGDEILFEAKPTDNLLYTDISSKLFAASELNEICTSEGWPAELLEPGNRTNLSHRLLEKLKIIVDQDRHKIEFYTFPEVRMLTVSVAPTINKSEIVVGNVEISSNFTLAELRVVINHELDRDLIPKHYRFVYRGISCSLRQEPFRKAWECLPKCIVVGKTIQDQFRTKDDPAAAQAAIEKALAKKKQEEEDALGNKKTDKTLVPVPIASLCQAQEGLYVVHFRHDMRNILQPGDVLRIGHKDSSDFVVPMAFGRELKLDPDDPSPPPVLKSVPIDPYFLTFGEKGMFYVGNYPLTVVPVEKDQKGKDIKAKEGSTKDEEPVVVFDKDGNPTIVDTSEDLVDPLFRYPVDGKNVKIVVKKDSDDEDDDLPVIDVLAIEDAPKTDAVKSGSDDPEVRNDSNEIADATKRVGKNKREPGVIFKDLWVWKCIPRVEDNRPKWRILYDNGDVKYNYVYHDSVESFWNFGMPCPFKVAEELCQDARCPDMQLYAQRVDEMCRIAIGVYTHLAYDIVCNTEPKSETRGINEDKFIKWIKRIKLFPDINKQSRISQIELAFTREVNGSEGDLTYVNYYGFCNLLQEMALIRYPVGLFVLDGPDADRTHEFFADDGPPKRELCASGSIDSLGGLSGLTLDSQEKIDSTSKAPPPKSPKKIKFDPKKGKKGKKGKVKYETLVSQVDPRHAAIAYRKFITDYFILVPKIGDVIWEKAKMFAMEKEAVRYCAAKCIQTAWRRGYHHYRFLKYKWEMVIKLQAIHRSRVARRMVRQFVGIYEQDWLWRVRWYSTILIQSAIRRFNKRCWFAKKMGAIKERQLIITKAKRQRQAKARAREKKGIVFRQIRRINGIMVLLVMKRKDQRNYSNDFGMRLEVYNPKFQCINVFVIDEPDLRQYMQDILKEEALSIGDLLNKKNLEDVISVRLLCRPAKRHNEPPKIILSRQALGQKGPKVLIQGKNCEGELFVCTLYETGYDLVVQAYHCLTSKIFPVVILMSALKSWVKDEYLKNCATDIERQYEPPLLKFENRKALHHWLIDNIVIDKRHGKFVPMFKCQLSKSVKLASIVLLQAAWRRSIQRSKIPAWVDCYMLKVKTGPYDDTYYYLNRLTGESSWDRPSLLRQHDLPTEVRYRWVILPYSVDRTLYVNPFTGRYTHLTPDQSARLIQAMIRNWLIKPYRLPKEVFAKSVNFEMTAEELYNYQPKRLAYVLNFALVMFCVKLDYVRAKRLLEEALVLADTNPLTVRIIAILLLSTVESPSKVTRERALELLRDGARRDKTASKFDLAYNVFFRYGCYRNPRNARAFLNLGLVHFYIYQDNDAAEVVLRRAVALAPFDQHVMANWKQLRDEFPEKKFIYRPRARQLKISADAGAKKRRIHGLAVIENLEWAGWVYVEYDPVMMKEDETAYWYHPGTGEQRKDTPVWEKEWETRAQRSFFEGESDGLEHYYDSLTTTYFQRHILTDTYY